MRLEGHENLATIRLRGAFDASGGNFPCAGCRTAFIKAPKMAEYIAAYKPRTEMMRRLVPPENRAAYIICVECARLPEPEVFIKAERYLVDPEKGNLLVKAKPADAPGRHTRKRSTVLGQDTRIVMGDGN